MQKSASISNLGSDWSSRGSSAGRTHQLHPSYSHATLRAPRSTVAQTQGRRPLAVHKKYMNTNDNFDPITGDTLVPAACDWTTRNVPRQVHSSYHTLPLDNQGNVKRHPYTHIPMVTRENYIMQRMHSVPYQSKYVPRNASASMRAAADVGYGRYKTRTGQAYDNMANYDNRIYGCPNTYNNEFDIITGERRTQDNTPNEPWAITTKRNPLLTTYNA